MRTVVVVGGGIAGLTVARELVRSAEGAFETVCLEAGVRPGGNIRTSVEDGFVCEWGPNGFLDNAPATLELARAVGLEERLLPADHQSKLRFIWRRGKLRRVPTGPGSLLASRVLSPLGTLRIFGEPFARARREGVDETVFDFAARRIGKEAARVMVGAMVTGIYAGDARELSLRATFPKMFEMESEHGGLFKALLAKKRAGRGNGGGPAGPGGHLTSFRSGLQELPDAVAAALGPALRVDHDVRSIAHAAGGFELRCDGAVLDAVAVVLASPAWHAAGIVRDLDPTLAATLGAIPSAPLAVIHLGYARDTLDEVPAGFGFLVPREEGPRMLGALFTSNIFPGRSPDGAFLITVMLGGAHEPKVLEGDDEALVAAARADLAATIGVESAPAFERVFRHPRGIPQYTVGHCDRMAAIERGLAEHPGLFVHGNSYRGVSVNACIEHARGVAEAVADAVRVRAAAT